MTGIIGVSLGTSTAAVPYLQTTALNAVKKAVIARGGVTMTVNSALRTLTQQLSFLLNNISDWGFKLIFLKI